MAEATLSKNIQETYANLKTTLAEHKCRIITEDPPNSVTAVQGSIWGTSPQTAQKKLTFKLQQNEAETHIAASSKLTSAYIKLTVAGVAFSVTLGLLCVWIAVDLTTFASTGVGYWGWLAYTSGPFVHFEPDAAAVFIRVTWILAAFLAGTLVAEAVIVANVQRKISAFTQVILKKLGS